MVIMRTVVGGGGGVGTADLPKAASTGEMVAAPIPADSYQKALGLLYQLTGNNPGITELKGALDKAMEDGSISRKEFEDILEEFGVDELTESFWTAFTGGKAQVTVEDLVSFLDTFSTFSAMAGKTLKYMCGVETVVIMHNEGFRQALMKEYGVGGFGIKPGIFNNNPELEEMWNAAKWITKGEVNEQTWRWFAMGVMERYIYRLTHDPDGQVDNSIDVKELDLKNPAVRQLFERKAMEWVATSNPMSEEDFEGLLKDQDTIRKMEKQGYSFEGVVLTKDNIEKFKQVLQDYRDGNKTIGEAKVAIDGMKPQYTAAPGMR